MEPLTDSQCVASKSEPYGTYRAGIILSAGAGKTGLCERLKFSTDSEGFGTLCHRRVHHALCVARRPQSASVGECVSILCYLLLHYLALYWHVSLTQFKLFHLLLFASCSLSLCSATTSSCIIRSKEPRTYPMQITDRQHSWPKEAKIIAPANECGSLPFFAF